MTSFLLVKNILLSIFAKTNSTERERLQNGCEQNLKALGKAIVAYRADHDDDMPDWLSDLYPEYLSDPELLLCPADKGRGNPVFKALTDPNMPCSYLYEFNPIKYAFSAWVFDRHPQEEYSYKELRTAQRRYFGNVIPVVRCWHHKQGFVDNRSLDLRYDGQVDTLPDRWETVSNAAFQAVLAFFQRAIEQNPDCLESTFSFQKITAYFRSCKRVPEFQSLLERMSKLSSEALRTLVELYESAGKIDAAIERCKQLLRQTPPDVDMRVTLARLYAAAKNYCAAQAEINRVLRLAPQNNQARRLHVELLAIDDATRVQNMFADTLHADDAISLRTRYSVKFQERLFSSEKTLLSIITESRLALQESSGAEKSVNQLGYLYETAEKSLSKDAGDWKIYSTSDGLGSDYVFTIAQDDRGVLWIGTGNGVYQYDGTRFSSFAQGQVIGQATPFSIFIDNEGQIWFGTHLHGVFRYDGQNLLNYTVSDGLGGNHVKDICQDRYGHLWLGMYRAGISRYDGELFTTFTTKDGLVNDFVWAIKDDSWGNLWVGTERGVSCFDGKGFTNFTTSDGLESDSVYAIAEDHDGYLWFGTAKGVTRYDGQEFANFVLKNTPIERGVSDVLVDWEGGLWAATWADGVFRYDGNRFANFTTQSGLAGNSLFHIFEDREGNIWFGHERGEGLSRFNPRGLRTYTAADGLSNSDVCVIAGVRMATCGSVQRMDLTSTITPLSPNPTET